MLLTRIHWINRCRDRPEPCLQTGKRWFTNRGRLFGAACKHIDDSLAVFGRPALEKIARGFDLRGHEIRDVSVIPKLFANFAAQGESEIWNIQISDQVTAPVIRQTIKRGHGNM